ncbi:hypothetical protein VYU27_009828 [Nannochloropsis oceanica]
MPSPHSPTHPCTHNTCPYIIKTASEGCRGAVPVPAPTHATSAGADPGGSAAAEGASLTESYARSLFPN